MPTKIKQSKSQKIPELRFPGFRGSWEERKFKDIFNVQAGGDIEKEHVSKVKTEKFKYPIFANSDKNIYTSTKQLSKKGIEKGRFIPKNSLLVTCIASIGKNTILRVDGSCNQQINAISPNGNNNVDFLYYLLEKNKNHLIRFAGAGGMQMLNKKDFSNIKFKLPVHEEQNKIANFLTSLDNLIESKQQQITQAQQWKKGLMQGLFV